MRNQLVGSNAAIGVTTAQLRIFDPERGMQEQGIPMHLTGNISLAILLLLGQGISQTNPVTALDAQLVCMIRMNPYTTVYISLEGIDGIQDRIVAIGGAVLLVLLSAIIIGKKKKKKKKKGK